MRAYTVAAPKWRIRKRVPRGRSTCGQLDSFSISEKVHDPRDPFPRTKACARNRTDGNETEVDVEKEEKSGSKTLRYSRTRGDTGETI